VAAEVDSVVTLDQWKGAPKQGGRAIYVCNGWKVLMRNRRNVFLYFIKQLKVEFSQNIPITLKPELQ
jgi:hypothetical protein